MQSSGDQALDLEHVSKLKVSEVKTEIEKTVDSAHLVWCPSPYEMPCQSLFFSLLYYKESIKDFNWLMNLQGQESTDFQMKLNNFGYCHLANIKGNNEHVSQCTTSTFSNQMESKEKLKADREIQKSRGNPLDREAPLLYKIGDHEDDGVWGNLETPFVGFKVASMTYRKRLKTEPEQVDKIDIEPEQKPKWM